MEICSRRHFLLIVCIWQLVSIVERQVFDFLGYLWVPILVNFFHIIFVIFGFFGAFQYRPKYIITYVVWCILWIGWNIFLICFYLSAGSLDKDSEVLNLGTGSISWFEVNGYGCRPVFPTNLTAESADPFRPIRPEKVNSCMLDYEYVEVLHSAIQCALAMLGGIAGILLSQIFLEEDDSFDFLNGVSKSPQHLALRPMYVTYNNSLHRPPLITNKYSTWSRIRYQPRKTKSFSSLPNRNADRIRVANSETNIISADNNSRLSSFPSYAKPRPKSLYTQHESQYYA